MVPVALFNKINKGKSGIILKALSLLANKLKEKAKINVLNYHNFFHNLLLVSYSLQNKIFQFFFLIYSFFNFIQILVFQAFL